jgi:hypothetical protein
MKTQAKPKAIPAKTRSAKPTVPATTAQKPAAKALQVHMKKGETEAEAMARCLASPTSNATVTLHQFHPLSGAAGGASDINALQRELGNRALQIRGGDMARPEAMLVAQAHSLDTIFNAMAQRAAYNLTAGYMDAGDRYMRMALKAQSQCRTTIEALVELKNPTGPTFVKQQNIAQNQQVNNGATDDSRSSTHAHVHVHEKDITPTNKLLEATDGERLDFGATEAASAANQGVETVGAINRAKDGRG